MALQEEKGRVYFHATPMENLQSIYACGITRSLDGYVHLATDAKTAVRYASSYGIKRVACFAVLIDDPDTLVKIDDFGCIIFNCDSLGYRQDIRPEQIKDLSLWDLTKQRI